MNIKRFERYSCIFFVMIGFVAAYIIGYKIGSEEESNVILRNEIESEDQGMMLVLRHALFLVCKLFQGSFI